MPPSKTDRRTLKLGWIKKLNLENQIKIDGAKMVCLPCEKSFSFRQRSELEQHSNTTVHKNSALRFNSKPERQLLLSESIELSSNKFTEDLCRALVAADIPWEKINNPFFKDFLQKYTSKRIPDASTLRKNYLPKIYNEAIEEIRRDIENSRVWVSVDETTDAKGRYIANVLIGSLNKNDPSKPHLIACKELAKTNNNTITQLVVDSLNLLWPGSKQSDIETRFLLYLTDGAKYMLKSGKNLKLLYKNVLHVTCTIHGLNRVAEEVRSSFPRVDTLIAKMKATFRKAPARIVSYKNMYPDLPLPPQPIITRWGTWLSAVEFYARNLEALKNVMSSLKQDSAAVKQAQEIISKKKTATDLAFLSAHFTFIPKIMEEMEERGSSLHQSLNYLNDVEQKLGSIDGSIGETIKMKFQTIKTKNPDLDKLKVISKVIQGIEIPTEEIENLDMDPESIASFKFAPITTVDVERSFSMHKAILSDRRQNFTTEHLEMVVVSHFEL